MKTNIFHKVLNNIENYSNLNDHHIEKVFVNNDDLLKKMIIVVSDHHNEYTIALDDNKKIKTGDVLAYDGKNLVIVIVNTNKLIEISPKNFNEAGYIAHNLGNRHIPCQFIDNKIYLVNDKLIVDWLNKNNYDFSIVEKKLDQPFEYAKLS